MSTQSQINELLSAVETLTIRVDTLQTMIDTNASAIAALSALSTRVSDLEDRLELISAPKETRRYLTEAQLVDLSTNVAEMNALKSDLETLRTTITALITAL